MGYFSSIYSCSYFSHSQRGSKCGENRVVWGIHILHFDVQLITIRETFRPFATIFECWSFLATNFERNCMMFGNTNPSCPEDTWMRVGTTVCPTGKMNVTEACNTINTMINSYAISTTEEGVSLTRVSPGTMEWMLPEILKYRVQASEGAWDMETFVSRNRTLYSGSSTDSRAKSDGTRSTGIFPQCSSSNCHGDTFTGVMTEQNYSLHDQLFRVDRLIEIAREYCST